MLEADPITRVKSSALSAKSVGGKRKRKSEEEEIAVKVAKKQRRGEEEIVSQRSVKGSRMRRSQRSKPEQEKNDNANPAAKSEDDAVITILDEDTEKKGINQFSLQSFVCPDQSITCPNVLNSSPVTSA